MQPRTVGVEEELLLVDPATRAVSTRAQAVLRTVAASRDDDLDQELFRHQLETRTAPTTDIGAAVEQVRDERRTAGRAAAEEGLVVMVSGSAPLGADEPVVTPDDRYRDMVQTYGEVARSATTCGMHVHVAIDSDDEGVHCLDQIAPWLPVLLAVSANSPFTGGRDSGYASIRNQMWSRWPSAGPTEPFGSPAGYQRAADRMIGWGAARDPGMLYFDARLSRGQPTLEVRVLDAVTDLEVLGALAGLARGLVQWASGSAAAPDRWRAEELRAATWRAARYGVADELVDPVRRELRPAREVVERLVALVSAELEPAGDADRVAAGVELALAGAGAPRQRAAHERSGGLTGVVDDLVTRTAQSWDSPSRA